MSTAAEHTGERQPLSEVVKEPMPKPPLGPPHDAWATVGLGVFFAVGLFFIGYGRVENDWIGWTGMVVSFALLIGCVQYFIRAYGFGTRGWNSTMPTGAYFAGFFAFFFIGQMVAPAIYAQYAGESTLTLVVSFLAVAALAIAPLRLALGRAPKPEPSVGDRTG